MQVRFDATSSSMLALAFVLFVGLQFGGIVSLAQESDLDAFRKLHSELRERMDADLGDATEYLESKLTAAPDSADLNVLRHSLASRLIEERNFKEANRQFAKLLDFQIKHVDQTENQFGIWMTIQSMQGIASKSGSDTELQAAVNRGLEALATIGSEHDPQPWIPVSQLTVLKAQFMVDADKADQARALVQEQLDQLTNINDSEQASEETMQALVRMLRSLTSPDRGNDAWRDQYIKELDDVVATAIDRYPDSLPLQNDYADTQFLMITQWAQDDPEATKQRIEAVTKKLALVAIRNVSVKATLRRIEVHKERMEAVKPVASLVGKPAPEWDIDAWVNAEEKTQESLQGKVVLIDFWAMWCGPCIATFPHLREWRQEFGDKGFEIVGVTQYYNFEWDEENKRASRSQEDVTSEQERETLASFLKHHQLEHPVFVNPEHSQMGSEFGVSGIPHVVLVDREGVVQLVKTGAGEATAQEIHAKIKELVEAEAKP
jgi:thiol-disulfide isomerase/thioredoxin